MRLLRLFLVLLLLAVTALVFATRQGDSPPRTSAARPGPADDTAAAVTRKRAPAGTTTAAVEAAARPADSLAAPAVAEAARSAVGDADPWAIRVLGADGAPLEATVTAVRLTPALQEFVEDRVGIDADLLAEVEPFHELQTTGGVVSLAGSLEAGECFVWASAPGHGTRGIFVTLPEPDPGRRALTLYPSPPLEVKVRDVEGHPLAGIEVYFSNPTWDENYTARPWRERLKRRFFLATVQSGADGVARLDWPLEGPMTVVAGLEEGYAKAFLYEARTGEENVLVLYRPAIVSGRVTDAEGRPLAEAEVTFLGMDGERTIGVGDAITDEDGRYDVEISTRFPVAVGAALHPGKAFLLETVLAPRPGEHRQLDFVLPEAVPADFQVVDATGRPAGDVLVVFKKGTMDWVPGAFTADAAGRFRVKNWLARGAPYLAWVMHGGILVDTVEFTAPREPGPVRLELAQAARIGRVEAEGAAVATLTWFSRAQYGRSTEWPGDAELSPVLAPGLGRLEARLDDGRTLVRALALQPGDNGPVHLAAELAELHFTLPRTGGGTEATAEAWPAVLLAAEGDRPVVTAEVRPGASVLTCSPGLYCLEVRPTGGGTIRRGPFRVPAGGLDLGRLEPEPPAGLSVLVEDGSGEPVAGIGVRVYGPFLASPFLGGTDARGRAVFPELPPGLWTVRVYPFDSALMPAPRAQQELRLEAGEEAELRFRLDPGRLFRGRVAGAVGDEVHGFHLAGASLEMAHAAGDGSFTVGVPAAGDWIGVAGYAPGRAVVLLRRFQAPVESHVFATGGLLERRLRFASGGGQETAAALEWWFAGQRLPGRAFPDAEGRLELAVTPGGPLEAVLRFADGSVRRLDPARLPEELDLEPGGSGTRSLQVVHPDGSPVAGAQVTAPELEHILVSDARGQVLLPGGDVGGGGMEVARSGHWNVFLPAGGDRAVLRRDLPLVEALVAAGLGARRVRLTPGFDLGRPLEPREAPVEDGAARFRHLPEGDWLAEALDAGGSVVAAASARLAPGNGGPPALVLR